MRFCEALELMEAGKVCRLGDCLYKLEFKQLFIVVGRKPSWEVCRMQLDALLRDGWQLAVPDEFLEHKVVLRAGTYVVEIDSQNHLTLEQCVATGNFMGFVYELPDKCIVSSSPMLFDYGIHTYNTGGAAREVVRPVAARFRRA